MAVIDILNLEPTKVAKNLSGRFVLVYGESGSGKTSLAVRWEKPLLVAFEKGLR